MTTKALDAFGQDYLKLVLEIDKHIEGYVDAYSGPAELRAEVNAGEKKTVEELTHKLQALMDHVPSEDAGRERYMRTNLLAVECSLRMLAGEEFEYLDEVERLFDIRPQPADEAVFQAAHRQLDALFPGPGDLGSKYDDWREQYNIAADKLPGLIELVKGETRRRTAQFVDLVEGEEIEIDLVSDKPWTANNVYLGAARSRVEWNTDIPSNALRLTEILAHEAYPGHHTEAMLKDKLLYQEKGFAEEAALLLHSPTAVISEAIATTAIEIIFPGESLYEWTADEVLPAAGLPSTGADELGAIIKATESIRGVGTNAAIKYHNGEFSKEDVIDYLQTYNMANRQRAEKTFEFMTHPLYRAYIFTYTEGYRLVEQAAMGGDKRPVFERLLVEQVLPSELREG